MNYILTLLFGLTIIVGSLMVLLLKNTKKINELSVSISFSVLVLLILLELIPEVFEHLNYLSALGFILLGIVSLKLLDYLIPEHDHSSKNVHDLHIGLITTIALIIHNIVEGMALYTSLETNLSMGLLIGLGIGIHNIPMGMIITSTLKKAKYSNKKIISIMCLIGLSTFFGGVIISIFTSVNNITLGIMLSLTLGMLIYITLFELLEHLKHQNKKNNLIGFLIGISVFIISLILGG